MWILIGIVAVLIAAWVAWQEIKFRNHWMGPSGTTGDHDWEVPPPKGKEGA